MVGEEIPRNAAARRRCICDRALISPVTSSFSVAARKNPNLTVHLSDLSAQNFALDLGKVKRIVVRNQPNPVRPDSTVD